MFFLVTVKILIGGEKKRREKRKKKPLLILGDIPRTWEEKKKKKNIFVGLVYGMEIEPNCIGVVRLKNHKLFSTTES